MNVFGRISGNAHWADASSSASRTPRRLSLSVRRRLLILVVGSGLLILGLSSFFSFNITQDIALQEIRSRAQELAGRTALELDERLARISQSARDVAAVDIALGRAGLRDLDLLHQALAEIAERNLDFLSVYIFYDSQVIPGREYAVVWETRDASKANLANKPTQPFYPNLPGEPGYDPSLPLYDYFRQTPRFETARGVERIRSAWTGLFRDPGGRPGNLIASVAPVFDSNDRFIGVAGVDLQFGQIQTYIAGVKPTENSYAILLDQAGVLIANAREPLSVDVPVERLAADMGSEALRELSRLMAGGRQGVMDMTDPFTGEDVFAAYAPVEQTGWSIGVMIPRVDLIGGVNTLRNTLLGIAGVALAALGGIGFLLGETIVRPLRRLTRTATLVATGDLTQVAAVERHDEIGALAATFNAMTGRLSHLIDSLESQVEARTGQLRASADVGRAAASILDPALLMNEVANLITDRFGFYYAAIFTLDQENKYAVLRAATGEAGRVLKEQGHRLQVGGESMVGAVTASRQPRVALDAGAEAGRFANPLLPDTRSEIALPLVVGDRVLGALDVQSTQAAAFDDDSVAVLRSMTDQVAIALANAQSFEIVQSALRQRTRLYELGRALFAATTAEEAYASLLERGVRLPGLDRVGVVIISARDPDGNPLEYELVAEWDAQDGTRVEPGRRFAPQDLPVAGLTDEEAIVVIRNVDDPRTTAATRRIMERASLKAVALIPFIVRGQYEGFVAAASGQPLNFSEGDVSYLQAAVEQLAIVLSSLRANDETRAALARIAQLNQRLSGEAWRQYLAAQPELVVESGSSLAVVADDVASRAASRANRLSMPIVVRGEMLGVLDLEDVDPQRQWTDDDWDLMNTITGEIALALENTRLLEQTQRRAAREAELNRIAEKIRRAGDIDLILRVAAEELGRSLDASHAHARLGRLAELAGRRESRP